jgi:protein SCO1/2
MSEKKRFRPTTIALAIIIVLLGAWAYKNIGVKETVINPESATVLNQPRLITPFNLIVDDNKMFTLDNLKGHWSLIFFGFTNCPDLCPTSLSILAKAYEQMQADKLNPMPQVIFISVDPERDSPERIATYLKNFNPNFLGATGDKADLDQLTQELSVIYAKVIEEDHYMIDHSGTIVIINPEGQFYGVFTLPHDANEISKDMQQMITTS